MLVYVNNKHKTKKKRKPKGEVYKKYKPKYKKATGSLSPNPIVREGADHSKIPSAGLKPKKTQRQIREEYNAELAERERIAQEEAERRKKCVAPLYNKGAYQYVYTEDQAKDIGR